MQGPGCRLLLAASAANAAQRNLRRGCGAAVREQAPQGKIEWRSERAEGAFVSTFVHLATTEGRDSIR